MRSANPALNDRVFQGLARPTVAQDAMTIRGTANKAGFLLLLVLFAAGWPWSIFFRSGDPASVTTFLWVGGVGGFVMALVTVFKKEWASVTAPIYAVLEGFLLGGLSAVFEMQFPGIVVQAVGLTFGTCAALLLAYRAGLIRATEKFKAGVMAATGGIVIFYLAAMVLGFFGVHGLSQVIFGNGLLGIGVSVVVCVVAALNLVIDFDFIEQGARLGAPKFMEWYGAFGLMVTLIWLYLEILRLLSKLRSRD